MKKNDFCVIILTYGRPEKQKTYNTLRKLGYTGEIFFLCSDDDNSIAIMKEKYGLDRVHIFSKKEYDYIDSFDNFENRKVIYYARNAC